jgi:hypothetical protein
MGLNIIHHLITPLAIPLNMVPALLLAQDQRTAPEGTGRSPKSSTLIRVGWSSSWHIPWACSER